MKLEINGYDNAVVELNRLISENKWAITVVNPESDMYVIQYTEHKKFVNNDGIDQYDEVWTDLKGTITFVQDMTDVDAKNALRALLKEERLLREEMLLATYENAAANPLPEVKPVLH